MGTVIGCAVTTDFNTFLAMRLLAAFASGVCEAIPIQLISDIYFVHERGSKIGYYTVSSYRPCKCALMFVL